MWMIKKLREIRKWYRKIYKFKDKVELKTDIQIPWTEKIKYNLIGFTDQDYSIFNLKENDYHNYISYKERWRLEDINGEYASILGNKLLFERLFGKYINVPRIYCWKNDNYVIDPETGLNVDIIQLLSKHNKMIAKPVRSSGGGIGVALLEYVDGELYLNHKTIDRVNLEKAISKCNNYIFVEYVETADYSKRIYSKTANSIRVVSTINKDGIVDFLLAFHRFGTDDSVPVDNISSGGLFTLVDLETGVLSEARVITNPSRHYSVHPDTRAEIEGAIIPRWDDLLKYLEKGHKHFPYFKFLAWDVVIDAHNDFYILEINRGCDLYIQMIKPQRYEKLGNYMQSNGLLDKW